HLRAGTITGRLRHPGSRRGDGAVVVHGREDERFEDDTLGERRLDRQQRRSGEIDLTLGIAADRAGEAVVRQPVDGPLVDDLLPTEEGQLRIVEAEVADHLEDPTGAGDDSVAATGGKGATEHLEEAPAV